MNGFHFEGCNNISEDNKTIGVITSVKTCWWPKINTKPIRTHALDGAVFPHMIHFKYKVNGVEYKGRKYLSYTLGCPNVDDEITVFYDPDKPKKNVIRL